VSNANVFVIGWIFERVLTNHSFFPNYIVSEPNSTTNNVSDVDVPAVPAFGEIERARTSPVVREGLPSSYRMRADSHYVDHLESRQPAGPDSWLDPAAIEAPPIADEGSLADLVDSIKQHGILQPLLVQHRDGQYRLISGHKRRRAAMLAGIRRVPCVLHAVDDDQARALGTAANLRPGSTERATPRAVDTSADVARSLETLSVYANLLSGTPSEMSRGLSADLIAAEAWRALCVVEATRIVQQGAASTRKLVAPRNAVERVARSFSPECRLRNVALEIDVQIPDGRMILADEQQLVMALSAAVIATMALFDRSERGSLRLSASVSPTGHLSLVVSQMSVVVPDAWAARAFDQEWTDRPGGASAVVSMLAVKKTGDAFGATVTAAAGRRGTSITFTIPTI
jgi:hypothetical protein